MSQQSDYSTPPINWGSWQFFRQADLVCPIPDEARANSRNFTMCTNNQHGGVDIHFVYGGPHCPRFNTRKPLNSDTYRLSVVADLTHLPLGQYACLLVGAGSGENRGLILAISSSQCRILDASAIDTGFTETATIYRIAEPDLKTIVKHPVVEITITRIDNLFFFSISGIEVYAFPVTPDLQIEEIFGVLLAGEPQTGQPVRLADLCVQLPA